MAHIASNIFFQLTELQNVEIRLKLKVVLFGETKAFSTSEA